MKYENKEITIRVLVDMIKNGAINLRPVYQRNFIWSKKDQQQLINTIANNFPMPNFFIRELGDGKYEMVDGQQRARTIFKFYNGEFADDNKRLFSEYDQEKFLNYKLNVVFIAEPDIKTIERFFFLVNKFGVHLNAAEINNAYYHDSDFKNIVNQLMDNQKLVDLGIFSDKAVARMNDSSLIEEIVAYLFCGITEKRFEVERLLREKIDKKEQDAKIARFCLALDRLTIINDEIRPIRETRFKQRNDFYSLFCFIDKHINDPIEVLKAQYQLLVYISDKGYITPTNDECQSFKEYAINCVSQSNSKRAREGRLSFLISLLCSNDEQNDVVNDVLVYLNNQTDMSVGFKPNFPYSLIDVSGIGQ